MLLCNRGNQHVPGTERVHLEKGFASVLKECYYEPITVCFVKASQIRSIVLSVDDDTKLLAVITALNEV